MRYWAISFTVGYDRFIAGQPVRATLSFRGKKFRRQIRCLPNEIDRTRVPWRILVRLVGKKGGGELVSGYIALHDLNKMWGEGCLLLTNYTCWNLFGDLTKLRKQRANPFYQIQPIHSTESDHGLGFFILKLNSNPDHTFYIFRFYQVFQSHIQFF